MKIFSQSSQSTRKIGLFGGTFNPVHRGHIEVANDVLQQFHLDTIHFIPCAVPPHKIAEQPAKPAYRLEMVQLALADQPNMIASDVEIQREGPSYTCDTLQYYERNLPAETGLYFLVGLDAFLEIHTWKLFSRLFDETAFVVMNRPGVETASPAMSQTVLEYAQQCISPEYEFYEDENKICHPSKPPIYLASVTPVDIASSQLRQMIQKGESIEPWVPPTVARFIEEKGLYR